MKLPLTKNYLNYSIATLLLVFSISGFAQCNVSTDWFIPASNSTQKNAAFLKTLPTRGYVLLGEHHANQSHHQWQLRIIQALYKKQKNMAIGLEMLPRDKQHVLNDWINGKISKAELQQKSDWRNYWSANFADYFPILDYAREKHIPLYALNISDSLNQKIQQSGWESVPDNQREGVGNYARPLRKYVRKLAKSFTRHVVPGQPIDKVAFLHFVQQQLVWDRAMAEKLTETYQQKKLALVVGLMGSWHIIDKEGVPFQLQDLKQKHITTLVPWSQYFNCDAVSASFADAIYGMSKSKH